MIPLLNNKRQYKLSYDLHLESIITIGPLNNLEFIEALLRGIKLNPAIMTKAIAMDKAHKTNLGLANLEMKEIIDNAPIT